MRFQNSELMLHLPLQSTKIAGSCSLQSWRHIRKCAGSSRRAQIHSSASSTFAFTRDCIRDISNSTDIQYGASMTLSTTEGHSASYMARGAVGALWGVGLSCKMIFGTVNYSLLLLLLFAHITLTDRNYLCEPPHACPFPSLLLCQGNQGSRELWEPWAIVRATSLLLQTEARPHVLVSFTLYS